MTERFRIKAPGKLILTGEYAVLFGAPAIVAAVARHATCDVTPRSDQVLTIRAMGEGPLRVMTSEKGAALDPAPAAPERWNVVRHVLNEASALPEGFDFVLDSSALSEASVDGAGRTVKLGLGSSAAVAVALTAALHHARTSQKPTSSLQRQWFEAAQRAHLKAQGGIGSGVDVAASAMGSVFVYRRPSADPSEAVVTPVRYEKLGVRMIAVWTGEAASTVDLVGKVEAWVRSAGKEAAARIEGMTTVAEQAAQAAKQGDRRGFLMALGEYSQQMEQLGRQAGADIVTEAHRRIREMALKHECVAKPSGAGGGDVAVCFCPSGWEADALRGELAKAGFVPLALDFDHEGATVTR